MKHARQLCVVLVAALMCSVAVSPSAAQGQHPAPGSTPAAPAASEQSDGEQFRADLLNVAYVPGKAFVCGAGVLATAGIMLISFGSAYRDALSFFDEGCGGKWRLTPEDLAGRRPLITLPR